MTASQRIQAARDEKLLRLAYNAHEKAEDAALKALYASLEAESVDALTCLADPEWKWQTRSWISVAIIDAANEVLDAKLEALVS